MKPRITGVLIGSFDILHPGYIRAFQTAKANCDHLTIMLHIDPSLDRIDKKPPIFTISDRINALQAIKYIDSVIPYKTEEDLIKKLKQGNFHIRFMGDDYKNKTYSGIELNISPFFIDRSHEWSTTKTKQLIYEQIKK